MNTHRITSHTRRILLVAALAVSANALADTAERVSIPSYPVALARHFGAAPAASTALPRTAQSAAVSASAVELARHFGRLDTTGVSAATLAVTAPIYPAALARHFGASAPESRSPAALISRN